MKLLHRLTMAATGLILLAGLAPAARAQTAYVDMDRLFQNYYKTIRSDSSFKKQKDLYSQHVTDGAAELDTMKKQLGEVRDRSLNIALSDEVRAQARKESDEKEGQMRDKQKELKDFLESKDKELGRKYLELRAEIVKELSVYIKNYAEREKLEMVLDVSGLTRNFIPAVVYYPKTKEITDKLLEEVNRGHEAEIPKDLPEEKKDGAAAAPAPAAKDASAGEAAPSPAKPAAATPEVAPLRLSTPAALQTPAKTTDKPAVKAPAANSK